MTTGSRSIELKVAPEKVWEQLVAPARRDWYYRLTAEGEFVTGGTSGGWTTPVRWPRSRRCSRSNRNDAL